MVLLIIRCENNSKTSLNRFASPHGRASKLSKKIKLHNMEFRLVYEVKDAELIVIVVAASKRERNAVCKAAATQ